IPRNGAPASLPSLLNKLTIMRVSGEASARPSGLFWIPGESAIASVSSLVRTLKSSTLAPVLTTIARLSGPVFSSVLTRPVDMARTEISTATTPAIPMTTTDEGPIRWGRLRMFITDTAAISVRVLMAGSSSARKRIDDVESLGAQRRRQPADHGQRHGNRE